MVVSLFSWVDLEYTLDGGNERIQGSVGGDLILSEVQRNAEPYEGMIFGSEDAARAYFDEYAGRMGFFNRVLSSRGSDHEGETISCELGCSGIRDCNNSGYIILETEEQLRQGCTATFKVERENTERWVVRRFVRDHNHPLVLSLPKRRPTYDEKDKKIQELTAELRVKKRLSTAYLEQLVTLMKDVENHNEHLTTKVQLIRDNLKELEDPNY